MTAPSGLTVTDALSATYILSFIMPVVVHLLSYRLLPYSVSFPHATSSALRLSYGHRQPLSPYDLMMIIALRLGESGTVHPSLR